MAAAPAIIQFHSVSRCFRSEARGELWAVRELDLDCAEGELTCLLGPSGCGKTTVLRLAAGLDQPTAGRVSIHGRPVTGPHAEVGFISQDNDLLPWRTVGENVALGLELRGVAKGERRRQTLELLGRVRLTADLAGSYPHELSGGMRQRVALARTLCINPRLLLMDEPFARLDEPTRHELQDELLDFWLTDRRTLLFVTHSLEEAVFLGDRIVVISAGRVVDELRVTLPRPRDRFSSGFFEMLRRIRSSGRA